MILPTVLILFLSALIRQLTGFGHALLAIPLVTLVVGIRTASPLVTLAGVVIGLVATLRSWRMVEYKSLWPLVIASILGIPLGIWLFQHAPEALVLRLLGSVLIGYSTYCLLTPNLPYFQSGLLAWVLGFVAGILGGAYNTSGPPIVIYAGLRRWSPTVFRATLQPYFLITSAIAASGHLWAGLWSQEVIWLFLYSLPAIAVGLWIGERITLLISKETFNRLIYGFLIVTGALLFLPL
jgi:uncharacterized membrane protein YfcA